MWCGLGSIRHLCVSSVDFGVRCVQRVLRSLLCEESGCAVWIRVCVCERERESPVRHPACLCVYRADRDELVVPPSQASTRTR
jgi:hypothetical protein